MTLTPPPRSPFHKVWQLEVVRFAIVGVIATLTHLATAWSILSTFSGSDPITANFAAFCLAFVVSFVGHRHFTFKSPGQPAKFLAAALLGMLVNNLVLLAGLTAGINDYVAIAAAALAAPGIVFILSKFWVFAQRA